MSETPKDRLSPTSLADLDESSPFNLAFQQWRRGDPAPLRDFIEQNGIRTKWERDTLAAILEGGDSLKKRKNSTEDVALMLRLYSHIRDDLELSWDEIYRRVSHRTRKDIDALKKLRDRHEIR